MNAFELFEIYTTTNTKLVKVKKLQTILKNTPEAEDSIDVLKDLTKDLTEQNNKIKTVLQNTVVEL